MRVAFINKISPLIYKMRKKDLIYEISNLLSKKNVFHKINNNSIITKKLKIEIPKVDEDISYLVGVISGDGSMITSKMKKGGYIYLIAIYSSSIEYLNYINKLTKRLFGYGGGITKDKRKQNTYRLAIQSATIFWYYSFLGIPIGKKSDILRVPEVFKENIHYFVHYLSGLIDTDGSVSNNRIQLKQKSKIFLEELMNYILILGMNLSSVKVNYTDSKPFYYVRFDNNLPLRLKVKPQ